MGKIRSTLPVKLFMGMLSRDLQLLDRCAGILESDYGPIDFRSAPTPWNFTDHYDREFGQGLLRSFLFFERLIDPGDLPAIKNHTNSIEERFSLAAETATRRRVNIDPGYLTEARVVLASTKDYAHRVYIGRNIYAEATLLFRGRSFQVREHTYPDFRGNDVLRMFNEQRKVLRKQLHAEGAARL